jgi:hypothetical protein
MYAPKYKKTKNFDFFLNLVGQVCKGADVVNKHQKNRKKCNVQKFTNSPFLKSRQKSAKKNMYGGVV